MDSSADSWDILLQRLHKLCGEYERITFANSLGAEDVVLGEALALHCPQVDIFCLDTGRLPEETLATLARLEQRYERKFRVMYPDANAVQQLITRQGINGFYAGQQQRHNCCDVRKVEPLRRALHGYDAWMTGLRRQQSTGRQDIALTEPDEGNGLVKLNPLYDFSHEQVWEVIKTRQIPYNPLHDRGYPSIGCAPCTRAVAPGDDPRSGRWWWERDDARECGLHNRP